MPPTSGTFTTYISKLKSAGYIGDDGDGLYLKKTMANLPHLPAPGEELVCAWMQELDGKAKDILKYVADVYPQTLERKQIADAVGMPPDSGTFTTYMSRINGKGLFEKHGRLIQASPAMME